MVIDSAAPNSQRTHWCRWHKKTPRTRRPAVTFYRLIITAFWHYTAAWTSSTLLTRGPWLQTHNDNTSSTEQQYGTMLYRHGASHFGLHSKKTINRWIYHFTHPPARTGRASDLWKLYISLQKNYQRSPMSVHTDTIKQILPCTCTLSTPADDRRALHSTLEPSLYE